MPRGDGGAAVGVKSLALITDSGPKDFIKNCLKAL